MKFIIIKYIIVQIVHSYYTKLLTYIVKYFKLFINSIKGEYST